jgi:hypothetical protein
MFAFCNHTKGTCMLFRGSGAGAGARDRYHLAQYLRTLELHLLKHEWARHFPREFQPSAVAKPLTKPHPERPPQDRAPYRLPPPYLSPPPVATAPIRNTPLLQRSRLRGDRRKRPAPKIASDFHHQHPANQPEPSRNLGVSNAKKELTIAADLTSTRLH